MFVGVGLPGVLGPNPFLIEDWCSKRPSPSRHVTGPELGGSCLGRKVSCLGDSAVRYDRVVFGNRGVGRVSVRQPLVLRKKTIFVFGGTCEFRHKENGHFLKLVAEPCFWIILLMFPIMPPGGDKPVEETPPARQECAWLADTRLVGRIPRNKRTRGLDDGMDARSRSLPSTPSSRMATHLSSELQEMLARSIVDQLNTFQAKIRGQLEEVANASRILQQEEHDLIMQQLSEFSRDSQQFAAENRNWQQGVQLSLNVLREDQRRLEFLSSSLEQQFQDHRSMLDMPMDHVVRNNDLLGTSMPMVPPVPPVPACPVESGMGVSSIQNPAVSVQNITSMPGGQPSVPSRWTEPSYVNVPGRETTTTSVFPPPRPVHRPMPPPVPSSNSMPQRWEGDEAPAAPQRPANWQLHRIAVPPKFEARNLEGWLREVKFWRNLHQHVDDQQMLASLGLHSVDEVKELLMDFYEEIPAGGGSHRVADFLERIKAEYGAVSDVIKAEKLAQLMAFKKKSDWDIRKFWRKFHQLQMRGRQAGVELDENIQFTQLFQALSLSNTQRQMVLAFFETSNSSKNLVNLKAITIRLFGSYCNDHLGTFVNQEEKDSSGGSSQDDEHVLVAAPSAKKKTKPGMEKVSLRRTTQNMGMPNGRFSSSTETRADPLRRNSTGSVNQSDTHVETARRPASAHSMTNAVCLRCGSPDHFWRQCPHPFRKNLALNTEDSTGKTTNQKLMREQLKKTLWAATEDLINFEAEEMQTKPPDNDDIPETINTSSALTTDSTEETLVWVCSVFRVGEGEQMNGPTNIIIDSGASGSVCSRVFAISFGCGLWDSRQSSTRRFKFGDSRVFNSEGSVTIPCIVTVERADKRSEVEVGFLCDVVDTDIPVLISREALVRMHATLCFTSNRLYLSSGFIQLLMTPSGHLGLPAKFKSTPTISIVDKEWIFAASSNEAKLLTRAEVKKIHIQLGHAQWKQLADVFRTAGYQANDALIQSVVVECGCSCARAKSHVSLVNAHFSPYPGYAVYLDIVYLQPNTGHKFPYLLILDSFSRFLVCVPSTSIRATELLQIFDTFWMHFLGRPRFMIRDGGPGLIGNAWTAYGKTYNVTMVCSPTGQPTQMGAIERHVSLLKTAIERISNANRNAPFPEIVRLACLARNNSLILGSGLTPTQILYGRNDLFQPVEQGGVQSDITLTTEETRMQRRLLSVLEARNAIMKIDAENTIKTCLRHNIRPGCQHPPSIGSAIDVILDGRWTPGWRMVGMIASNVVAEHDGQFRKIPLSQVRPAETQMMLPNAEGERSSSSLPVSLSQQVTNGVAEEMIDLCWNFFGASVMDNQYDWWFQEPNRGFGFETMTMGIDTLFAGTESSVGNTFTTSCPEEDFDPSRLPPKLYLADKMCVDAIVSEISGLLAVDSSGTAPLIVVDRTEAQYRGKVVVKSTLVVRWKNPTRAKARLCIRGDMLPIRDQMSAPTPCRSAIKTFIFVARACNFKIGQVDISQAFLQADVMNLRDQILVEPPDCIILPWTKTVLTRIPKPKVFSPHVFLVRRPLYGLRESPLRWFIHMSTSLRKHGYRQNRGDICLYTRLEGGILKSLVLLYVDDLLVGFGSDRELRRFEKVVSEYRTSDLEFLAPDHPLVFIGIDIRMSADGNIWLSQQSFIARLKDADPTEVLKEKQICASEEKLKTFFRRHLGNLIWCLQTRFDIGFLVTEYATTSPYVADDPPQVLAMVKLINRMIGILRGRVVELQYGGFFDRKHEVTQEQLGSIRIFIFSDAGFGTLRGSRSVEAAIIVGGKEKSRDGSIICEGSSLDFYSRKIGRVVRSTIAAEAVASANAIEVGLWHHAILSEIITGKFVDLRPNNEDTFPLCSPFRAYCDDEASRIQSGRDMAFEKTGFLCTLDCHFEPMCVRFSTMGLADLRCNVHSTCIDGGPLYRNDVILAASSMEEDSVLLKPSLNHPNIAEREAMTLLKVVALSDCANVYSAVSNWQPRSVDKLTNLSLCFIRDLSQQIHYSFLDADYNVADTSTKVYGNRQLFYLLCDTRKFVLSFVGRKKMKLIKNTEQSMPSEEQPLE